MCGVTQLWCTCCVWVKKCMSMGPLCSIAFILMPVTAPKHTAVCAACAALCWFALCHRAGLVQNCSCPCCVFVDLVPQGLRSEQSPGADSAVLQLHMMGAVRAVCTPLQSKRIGASGPARGNGLQHLPAAPGKSWELRPDPQGPSSSPGSVAAPSRDGQSLFLKEMLSPATHNSGEASFYF